MSILRKISDWFSALAVSFAEEWHIVLHDGGVLMFFVLLPLFYPITYTLIYNPEVIEKAPIAVVDYSRTPDSRRLVRDINATQAIDVVADCANMQEAKRLMAEKEVFGILEIPADYTKNIGRVEQSTATFYSEMSLMLRFRAFAMALTDVQIKTIQDITSERVKMAGAAGSSLSGMPVESQSYMLGDPDEGFASFVMPGILVLILQQSMVLGAVIIMGSARERRRRFGYDPEMPVERPFYPAVWGRALCYTIFYIAPSIFVLHWVPEIFNLPHSGNVLQYILLMLPMLLASAFFGMTIGWLVRDRESVFMVVVVTSVFFLFLSGLTWPTFAMPAGWQVLADFIPSTWGVKGFILINSNNATLADVSQCYLWLWGLVLAYSVIAAVARYHISRSGRRYVLRNE